MENQVEEKKPLPQWLTYVNPVNITLHFDDIYDPPFKAVPLRDPPYHMNIKIHRAVGSEDNLKITIAMMQAWIDVDKMSESFSRADKDSDWEKLVKTLPTRIVRRFIDGIGICMNSDAYDIPSMTPQIS